MLDRVAPPVVDERTYLSHKHFFACLAWALHAWPDQHEFEPANVEHLRAWLACHDLVMHCECHGATPPGLELTEAEVTAFYGGQMEATSAAGGYSFLRRRADGRLELRRARTMAYEANGGISRQAFRDLAEKIFKALYVETGFDIDKLKAVAKRQPRPEGLTVAG